MAKRDKLEIIRDILVLIKDSQNSIKPTPLLRKSNLSSQSFSEYLKELKEKKLIIEKEDKKRKRFISITDKGFRYIEKYFSIIGFIEEFEL